MLDEKWRKSTKSDQGNCVEVRRAENGMVQVRNSNWPECGFSVFTADEWTAFLGGAKEGEFDL